MRRPRSETVGTTSRAPNTRSGTSVVAREGGFTVASAMWVMAVTLILVTMFANLFIHRYAQAVIRQATDEGARAWAVNGGSQPDCQAAAQDVVGDLLGGSIVQELSFACGADATSVRVTAQARLAGFPPLPDSAFETTAVVTRELDDGLVEP